MVWLEDGVSAWVTHLFAVGDEPFLTNIEMSGDGDRAARVRASFKLDSAGPHRTSILAEDFKIAEGGFLTLRGHPAQVPTVSGWNRLTMPVQYSNIRQDIYSPDSTIQSSMRHFDLGERRLLKGYFEKIILSAVWVHDPNFGNALVGHGWNAGVSGPIDVAFSEDGRTQTQRHSLPGCTRSFGDRALYERFRTDTRNSGWRSADWPGCITHFEHRLRIEPLFKGCFGGGS